MGLDRNDESEGPRRRRGRAVVRLDTGALWNRLALLGRSQNWLAGRPGSAPATSPCWSTKDERLRDASAEGFRRPSA